MRKKKKAASKTYQAKTGTTVEKTVDSNAFSKLWIVGLLAALLGGILYVNTIGYDYTLDDFSVIKDNWVTQKGLQGIPTIFTTEYRYGAWSSPGSLYRPLTSSMFALEWQLSPDNPSLGHLINVLLYGLTGFLLWRTWRVILRDYSAWLPALAVFIFMAHPIHTEVVANIKSRDEILAMLFVTLSLHALWKHLDTGKITALLTSVFLYGVALFCKESSITFLAIFPLVIWFFRENAGPQLAKSALYLIPAALYLVVRRSVLSNQNGEEAYSILDNFIIGAETSANKLASAVLMCGVYLSKLLLPIGLVSDKGYPQMVPTTFGDWRAILSFMVYAAALVWALMHLKKKHFLSFAILFYLITFSLFSNVFYTIGTSYGERVLYAPSLGFAFAVAWLLWRFVGNKVEWKGETPTLMLGLTAGLVLFYAVQTVSRNTAWENSYTLYAADQITSPNCAKLNYHTGLEEANRGMDEEKSKVVDKTWVEKAIKSYTKAIELYPNYHDAYGGRGLAYFRLGDYEKAMSDYEKAIKYRPNDAKVLSNMGFIYFQVQGNKEKAEEVYRKALQYDPRFVDAHRNLGAVLALTKRYDEAISHFKQGLDIEPENATLWLYMGYAHRDKGDLTGAKQYLDKAYQLDPRLKPQG